MVVVAYDVSTESEGGQRRLRRVANLCEDFWAEGAGSVFWGTMGIGGWTRGPEASREKRRGFAQYA